MTKSDSSIKQKFIEQLFSSMSLEQKIGQMFVIGFTGTMVTPCILDRIRKYHPAGIRVGLTLRSKTAISDPYATSEKFAHRVLRKPSGLVKDLVNNIAVPSISNAEYCEVLNKLKQAGLDNGDVPAHITIDMEGDASADYPRGGIHFFPNPMGLTASGNPEVAYKVGWAIGRQVAPLGVSWIHSPVLDVNTNPLNPEIGTRSFSGSTEEVIRYSKEMLRGLTENGIICTGKHFPGRGACSEDAHSQLPTIDLSRKEMDDHIRPFVELFEAGLPAIMSAHTAYPQIDKSGLPASLSKIILTDMLKREYGFKGVITTDDITMGGIVEKFEVAQACIEAIKAGNDLILFREEGNLIDEVFPALLSSAKNGQISEERIKDAVLRTLGVKYDFGFFKNGTLKLPELADEGINDPVVVSIADTSARSALQVIDHAKMLPVDRSKRILLIEQVNPLHKLVNSQQCHPALLWENFFMHSPGTCMVEVNMEITEQDQRRVLERIDEADIIVATNYYYRRAGNSTQFIEHLSTLSKPLIVITNTPYPFGVSPAFKTVVISYGASPESMKHVAEAIFGAQVFATDKQR